MSKQSFTSQQNRTNAPAKPVEMETALPEAGFEDNRPSAIAQGKMIDGIQHSPKTTAQRQAHEAMFGETMQAKAEEEELQMKSEEDELQMKPQEEELQMKPEEEELQMKANGQPLQMKEEMEDLMQGKFSGASSIQRKAENGLPTDLNSKLESGLGADFSNVNIHTNSQQASQMNALAYTQGNDVHFAPGQFKPNTSDGQQLIGHELTHVVQQAQGMVKPTTEVNGMPVNDDKGLEGQADKMGEKIARM